MMEGGVHPGTLEIPPRHQFVEPAVSFIDSYAKQLGIDETRRGNLRTIAEAAIDTVVKNNPESSEDERIGIDVFESQGNFVVEVLNRGVPLFLDEEKGSGSLLLSEAAKKIDKVSIQNLGRRGQTVVLNMRLGQEAAKMSFVGVAGDSSLEGFTDKDIVIREMAAEEAPALSQLFYYVYGYHYINEFIYFPEKISQMIREKKLISIVASLPNGRLVGHVGLLQWNNSPAVYEPCLGVTDPRMKSKGLFGRIFQVTMDHVNQIEMQYCFFDFVTNHDYTQRFVARYSMVELALFVGCQSKDTQAKLEKLGIGADPKEMDRYSLLLGAIPRTRYPFGQTVQLPNNLGELLGFLLKPLNINWIPVSRFQVLPQEGKYETHVQAGQSAVVFSLDQSGRKAVEQILNDWAQFLRNGYQYGAVEIPVEQPGLSTVYDLLTSHGFFISGFVPYRHSDKLAIRLQSIGYTRVAFDEIRVCTERGKKLLEIVRESYERNRVS